MFLVKDASRKSTQVRRTAEEATPDVKHLQPQQTKGPDIESVFWPLAEGTLMQNSLRTTTVAPPVAQKLIQSEIQSIESGWRSTADEEPSDAASLENTLTLEDSLGLGELKSVGVNVMSEEEKEKKKKSVKSGVAKKQSLR